MAGLAENNRHDSDDLEAAARRVFRGTLHEDVREEFINGRVVRLTSALNVQDEVIQNLARLLGVFVDVHQLGATRSRYGLSGLDARTYSPTVSFWNSAKARLLTGNPENDPLPDMVAHVLSATGDSETEGVVPNLYVAIAIAELWIINPRDCLIQKLVHRRRGYDLVSDLGLDDVLQSSVIPGLKLPLSSVFEE